MSRHIQNTPTTKQKPTGEATESSVRFLLVHAYQRPSNVSWGFFYSAVPLLQQQHNSTTPSQHHQREYTPQRRLELSLCFHAVATIKIALECSRSDTKAALLPPPQCIWQPHIRRQVDPPRPLSSPSPSKTQNTSSPLPPVPQMNFDRSNK